MKRWSYEEEIICIYINVGIATISCYPTNNEVDYDYDSSEETYDDGCDDGYRGGFDDGFDEGYSQALEDYGIYE